MKYRDLFLQAFQILLGFRLHTTAFNSTREDFTLGAEHIPDLAEFLVPYAFQWKDIGTAMRFKPQYLQSCCHGFSHELPKHCLQLLLENWIKQKYVDILAPTVNNLEKVLHSELVGEGALACEVRKKIQMPFCSQRGTAILCSKDKCQKRQRRKHSSPQNIVQVSE